MLGNLSCRNDNEVFGSAASRRSDLFCPRLCKVDSPVPRFAIDIAYSDLVFGLFRTSVFRTRVIANGRLPSRAVKRCFHGIFDQD